MGISNADAEHLADEIYLDRRIVGQVYCGRCGYNLRTLPYKYRCPECGNEYNARPLIMRGVFKPHEMEFPYGNYILAAVLAIAAFAFGHNAFSPVKWVPIGFAGGFVVLMLTYLVQAASRTRRYFHCLSIARRIEAEERDW